VGRIGRHTALAPRHRPAHRDRPSWRPINSESEAVSTRDAFPPYSRPTPPRCLQRDLVQPAESTSSHGITRRLRRTVAAFPNRPRAHRRIHVHDSDHQQRRDPYIPGELNTAHANVGMATGLLGAATRRAEAHVVRITSICATLGPGLRRQRRVADPRRVPRPPAIANGGLGRGSGREVQNPTNLMVAAQFGEDCIGGSRLPTNPHAPTDSGDFCTSLAPRPAAQPLSRPCRSAGAPQVVEFAAMLSR
jgi:hypothetical protein